VTINGLLSGGICLAAGAVEFIGTVKANGKTIDDTHTHGGVQTAAATQRGN
jgi:hypothetical protein